MMVSHEIPTKSMGVLTFSCRAEGGYLFVSVKGQVGPDGEFCCHGGSTSGEAIRADKNSIEPVARRWVRERTRNHKR